MADWDIERVGAYACFSLVAAVQIAASKDLRTGLMAIISSPVYAIFIGMKLAKGTYTVLGEGGEKLFTCTKTTCTKVSGNVAAIHSQVNRPKASKATAVPEAGEIVRRKEQPDTESEYGEFTDIIKQWREAPETPEF